MPTPSTADHHSLSAHEVVLLLETDLVSGLSEAEVRERRERFGPNSLPVEEAEGLLARILRQFHHPLIYVLIAAGVITAALREVVDSLVIFGVVLINAVVGFIQESKAEAALESLRSLVHTSARVVRGGREHAVVSEDLVPGDLVVLEAGDKVPADLRLVRQQDLKVNESALTGESAPVRKDELALPVDTPVADRRNMVYSGTLVTAGGGTGVVVATGVGTELGEIHRLVGAAEVTTTPLTEKLARFSKILTVAILALAAATFGVGLLRRQDAVDTFTAAIALAVGAIPEGLPAAVTIALAIGVARMARRRAVIRRLPAVETLGGTTVICSDKTGTLTENQMTVREIWTPENTYTVTGTGYAPDGVLCDRRGVHVSTVGDDALRWCLLAGACCNDAALSNDGAGWAVVGDPTEGAMRVAAVKAGLDPDRFAVEHLRVDAIPFSSERQYMATLHRFGRNDHLVLAKGSVERMLDVCSAQMGADGTLRPLRRSAVMHAAEKLTSRGLRVLATALRSGVVSDSLLEDTIGDGLVFIGLQAMRDPPRPAASAAVAACHAAGIAVKMITGDHANTAASVAADIGVLDGDDMAGAVLTGAELAGLGTEQYSAAVERAKVFARVSPEQKLRLVEALQGRGHVVAMTGDGVNDAPALRQASIGVAMGRSGTEVAKDAADMVLTDDDFATIEAAVEEGRGVFDNLTKFITWTLPTNLGEGLVILVAIATGAALPILPTQILWINMTTAVALGLMLAFEPKEPGIMARPPRDPDQPLLTGALAVRIVLVSALLVISAGWIFEWELGNGASLAEARTSAVNLFVVVEAFYLFSCRSLTHSVWQIGLLSNRWVIVGVTGQAVAQLALTYLPAMNTVFGTAPISAGAWTRIFAVAVGVSIVVAIDKRLRRIPSIGRRPVVSQAGGRRSPGPAPR